MAPTAVQPTGLATLLSGFDVALSDGSQPGKLVSVSLAVGDSLNQ